MNSSDTDRRPPRLRLLLGGLLALSLAIFAGCGGSGSSDSSGGGDDHFKIALVMSYSGNEWQDAATNQIKAVSQTKPWSEDVDFEIQIAGTDPQKQSQLITEEVTAGADAILVYPISPTAINQAVRKACDQGVIVINYDSWTTEPCSYNIHADIEEMSRSRTEWMAKTLGGKGEIASISGVPGTTFDTVSEDSVDEVLKKFPGIKLVARENGEWSQPGARDAISKIISAHPDIDGVVAQIGCWGISEKLQDLGHDPIPCAGNLSTGHMRLMLPKGKIPQAIGLESQGASESTYPGALAFLQAYNMLKGGKEAQDKRCHETVYPPTEVTSEDVSLGDDATNPGNVYGPDHRPKVGPGFLGNFYSPLVGQGLKGSLEGVSDQITKPTGPKMVGGDDKIDGVSDGDRCLLP